MAETARIPVPHLLLSLETLTFYIGILFLLSSLKGFGQHTILLSNPSFEGKTELAIVPEGWIYRGFPGETPPDLLPYRANFFYVDSLAEKPWVRSSDWGYGVSLAPFDGRSYLGMVTRDNETWESLSQKLAVPLAEDTCYQMQVQLASSMDYHSASRTTGLPQNYNAPTRLVIHSLLENGKQLELLGATPPVDHPIWQPYTLILKPDRPVKHLQFSAWYAHDSITAGNLLLDHIQPLQACPCNVPNQWPIIDTIRVGIPVSTKQQHLLLQKMATHLAFDRDGQPASLKLFRVPGTHRAVYSHPSWHVIQQTLPSLVKKIKIVVESSSRTSFRKCRKWIQQECLPIKDQLFIEWEKSKSQSDTSRLSFRFR